MWARSCSVRSIRSESHVVQTKREKPLGITTTADFSLHSSLTTVMNYFQAAAIHHKADNESTLTALFQSLHRKPLNWRPELPHSLWKLKASVQISVQTANGCSERNRLDFCDSGLTLTHHCISYVTVILKTICALPKTSHHCSELTRICKHGRCTRVETCRVLRNLHFVPDHHMDILKAACRDDVGAVVCHAGCRHP